MRGREIYHLARRAIERYAEAEERRRKRLRPEGEGPCASRRCLLLRPESIASEGDIVDEHVDLMTPEEAAEYIRVSRSMIYQLCEERRIAHLRIGGARRRGKILLHRRDLDAFLTQQRVDSR